MYLREALQSLLLSWSLLENTTLNRYLGAFLSIQHFTDILEPFCQYNILQIYNTSWISWSLFENTTLNNSLLVNTTFYRYLGAFLSIQHFTDILEPFCQYNILQISWSLFVNTTFYRYLGAFWKIQHLTDTWSLLENTVLNRYLVI